MPLERWQQIEAIYHAALERAPAERAAYVAQACAGDAELRHEVESLLAYDDRAAQFLAAPLDEVAAALMTDELPSLIGTHLNHYQILSLLGQGGMGEVYLAEDTRLGRKVALKLLPASLATNEEARRRFTREARAASALAHPNICTIHEIGEANGHRFIVMEYVEGETLAAKLKRERLCLADALALAAQIADALAEAHAHQIIHRDIKPANIIITPRGQAKVLDFGLAKFITETPPADSKADTASLLSTPGQVMGTVPYMSPEQVRGERLDARTDIFSFGTMLYEMLSGQQPFARHSSAEIISAILTKEPEPLRQHDVAPEVEQVVLHCLAKEREQRYPSARELLTDLDQLKSGNLLVTRILPTDPLAQAPRTLAGRRAATSIVKGRAFWLAVGVLVIAVLTAALVYWRMDRASPAVSALPEIKSLAVLPLENLSGDPSQEYFADGMTEALISNLSQVRALRVISRTSVMRFKGSRKPLAEIARELNVEAVIEGSVQRDGGRIKITARLIRVMDDTPLRSFDYERELADVLKLQSDVARAVAAEIRTQVTAEERMRLASARRVNPEAHEAYLLGRYQLRRQNEADLKLAIGHFERAIQLDASYAAAWAGLSFAWLQRGLFGATSFREAELPARQATVKALELDAGSAEGYTSLALLKARYDWDWAGAEHDYRRAIELDPGHVEAHRFFAFLLSALGRHTEAIGQMETAEQLDPLSSLVQSDFGNDLNRARNYEQAERHLKRAIDLDPLNYGAYFRLGDLYGEMGRYADAIASLEKAETLEGGSGSNRRFTPRFALMYARMGRREEALRILKELQRTTDPARFPARGVAFVWAALGNKDEAFRLLFDAVEKRDDLLIYIKVDPRLDSLHSDPRWKELLRPMNFPE